MAGCSVISLSWVVLLQWLELMLHRILQRNKNWLPIGKHDSMAWLSRLLLKTSHPGFSVTRWLGTEQTLAGNYTCALSVGISGSRGTLRKVQGGEGDLFSHSSNTMIRGSQTTNHLLHLEVE